MLIETSTEHFFELPVVDIWVRQQISIQARRDVKPRQFLAKISYSRIINCSGVNQFFLFSSFAWSSQIYDTRKVIRNSTYNYRRGYINFLFMWNLTNHLINQAAGMRTITSGNRILGKKLLVHIISKNSLNFSRSLICNRFILKSPTTVAYLFLLCNKLIIGESSVINFEIF